MITEVLSFIVIYDNFMTIIVLISGSLRVLFTELAKLQLWKEGKAGNNNFQNLNRQINHIAGGNIHGRGAKPASVVTLEGQKLYFVR